MPQRSFLGIGVLLGLIVGAFFGIQTGNLAFCIIGGVLAGVGLALVIDWLARLKPGQGEGGEGGGGLWVDGSAPDRNDHGGHHGHGHGHGHGGHDGGGHGGDGGGGDGGGGGD